MIKKTALCLCAPAYLAVMAGRLAVKFKQMLTLFLISAVLLGIGFAGIAIKIWAKKDGEFDGTCSSRNATGKGCACGGGSVCENDKPHNHDREESYFDGPAIVVKKIN